MNAKLCKVGLVALIISIFVGCVPSWHPLFTDKDLIFDPKLVGTWKGDHDSIWKFEKEGDKHYKLSYSDKEGKATFVAFLLSIKDRRFLNVVLEDDSSQEMKLNALAWMTLVPVHLFLRVDEIGTSVKMAVVDSQWLHRHLKENPNAITHLSHPNRDLLTAETKELQEFVLKHAEGKGLFGDSFMLQREVPKLKRRQS
jgi:hypothetical protein